jgi:hypothetical protein
MSRLFLGLPLLVVTGCLTPATYPTQYAVQLCASAFTCVNDDELTDDDGWEDELTCVDAVTDLGEATPGWRGVQDGACTFEASEAQACIDALVDVRSASSCTGDMTLVDFATESTDASCARVYDCLGVDE